MIVLKLIALFLFLIVIPILVGAVTGRTFLKSGDVAGLFVCGYLTIWALVELVGIPLVLWSRGRNYVAFVALLSLAMLVMVGIGGLRLRKERNVFRLNISNASIEDKIYGMLIFLAIAFQIFMAFYYSSLDADDFYFNAQALSAQAYGTMYRIDANTGHPGPIDIRHAMALFPMWEAYLSSVTGLHVSILVHRAIPVVLIPLSYYVIFLTGCQLFPDNRTRALIFTLLINVWRVFGYVSYFTTETFFLLRTWQGKSAAGNIILPFIILMFLKMYADVKDSEDTKDTKGLLFLLAITVLASGSSSSLATMLATGLIALLSILFGIATRKWKKSLNIMLTCIPGCAYILIYILAAH